MKYTVDPVDRGQSRSAFQTIYLRQSFDVKLHTSVCGCFSTVSLAGVLLQYPENRFYCILRGRHAGVTDLGMFPDVFSFCQIKRI